MSWLPSPEYAEWWYDLSWKGIIAFGALAAFATAATVMFTVLQFWSDGVRDRRSDARQMVLESETASAKADAARANESAAVLEKEAAALKAQAEANRLARIKIEQHMAPRRLSAVQRDKLASELAKLPSREVAVIGKLLDGEAMDFADDLEVAIKNGGWSVPLRNKAWIGGAAGITLGSTSGMTAAAKAPLSSALNAAGVAHSTIEIAPSDTSIPGGFQPGHVYVLVGPKP